MVECDIMKKKNIDLYKNVKKNLEHLVEAHSYDIDKPKEEAKQDIRDFIEKISYASFLIDLTNQVYKQCEDASLYDLLISSLIKINDNFNPLIITNIIELKYLEYLGVMPNLNGCSICGSKSVVTLSSDKGGYLCSKCHTNEPIVSEKAIKLVRMYTLVDINKIEKLDIKKEYVYQVNNFIDDYYDRYTGLYLKSKTFLKNIMSVKK